MTMHVGVLRPPGLDGCGLTGGRSRDRTRKSRISQCEPAERVPRSSSRAAPSRSEQLKWRRTAAVTCGVCTNDPFSPCCITSKYGSRYPGNWPYWLDENPCSRPTRGCRRHLGVAVVQACMSDKHGAEAASGAQRAMARRPHAGVRRGVSATGVCCSSTQARACGHCMSEAFGHPYSRSVPARPQPARCGGLARAGVQMQVVSGTAGRSGGHEARHRRVCRPACMHALPDPMPIATCSRVAFCSTHR